MRKLLVIGAFVFGVLASAGAHAQSVLPRAGWVANASSSNGGDVPSHVLDGSASTRWTTGGNQTPGQWFTIDFGTAQTFTQVTMDVAGNTSDYARSYELYVSNDGQTWGAPVANGVGATGVITIVFPSQTARFVGIVQTGSASGNWWSIAELNVYTGTVPTVPLTPSGWTATASVSGSSDQPSKAIDGSLSTRFSTDTAQVNGQWFQLDMGSAQLLAALKMDSDGNTTDYARGYQIFASNSTSSWGTAVASGTATSSPITVYFPQTTARYVKIVQTGSASNWWSIAELTMYTVGSGTPTASVLAHSGWTATASSSGSGNGPANALDDNGSTRWSTGANQVNGQYFVVDMQATRSFSKVTLDAGSSSSGDYPRGYQVYVSGDGASWGSAVATGTGSSQLTTINLSTQVGRYIKVVQTGTSSTNGWSIAELNVFGTPPAILLRDNWTASASPNNAEAGLGLDGKVETQWSTNTAQVSGQSYQIDMKVTQSFNQVVLDVECNPADYPRGVQVYVSSNGTSWGSPIASATGMSAIVSVSFAGQSARYLKVVQTASATNYWGIAELNVINTNPSACSSACVALDACHDVGTCNPSTGVCSNPVKVNGTACNDGNACTQTDTCQVGVCTGGNAVTCAASDQCHTAGTCNGSTGVCSNPAASNGTSCSDGNACTQTDTCQAGVCTGGSSKTCTASDACHTAGTCDPASGACSNPVASNGTSCSDGNACTRTDTCQAGVCTGGNSVACAASDQCHSAGICDPTTGVCTNPVVANGTACNDGSACTSGDTCQSGACAGAPKTCVASDQCHAAGTCDPTSGACSNPAAPNGTTCNDGNLCTTGDVCQAGACTGAPKTCAAGDQCHLAGTCNPTSGVCSNPVAANGTTCNDGNACTTGDVCQAGACTGAPKTCAASDQCHLGGTCDPTSGVCSNPVAANGTTCSDGNACTQSDTCQAGACTGGAPVTCVATDQCHAAGTCNTSTGACTNPVAANGTTCSDGNACTQTDTCQSGTCTGGSPVTCAASDQCHSAGTCDTSTGACSNPAKVNGATCNDGNACTQTDSCQSGTCTGSNSVTCAASDQCHSVGTCDTSTGACSNPVKANGTACSDGNACTQTDTCVSGTCTGSNSVTCAASDQCHAVGTCDPASGTCSNPALTNGTACNDGDACTTGDSCASGVCTPGASSCGTAVVVTPENQQLDFSPSLNATVTPDRTVAAPGELVSYSVQATYNGLYLSAYTELDITNNGTSTFVIPGYSDTLEYFSPVSHQWVQLGRVEFDAAGHAVPSTTPIALPPPAGPVFISDPFGGVPFIPDTPGVTYSANYLAGTSLQPGSTARVAVFTNILLSTADSSLLFDPGQSTAIRMALRINQTPGLDAGADVLTNLDPMPTPTDMLMTDLNGNVSVNFAFPGVPLTPASNDPLALGSTRVLSASAPAPTITPPDPSLGEAHYLDYLRQVATSASIPYSVNVEGTVNGLSSNGGGTGPHLGFAIPILSANKSGPGTSVSGSSLAYSVGLANTGSGSAQNLALSDSVEGAMGFSVAAPGPIAVGASASAPFQYQSDPARPAGPLSDVVSVTWQDTNNNIYGPITSSFTTTLSAGHVDGQLFLAGDSALPVALGSTKTFTVTALTPFNTPAASAPVQLTITGQNARTLTGVTGSDGTVQFSYSGTVLGEDQAVATATVVSTPLQTTVAHVLWASQVSGVPCTDATPVDLMLVIDTSPSMLDEGKIQAVDVASSNLIDDLDLAHDQVGVVEFMGNVQLVSPLSSNGAQVKTAMDAGIQGAIGACAGFCAGGTNIPGALDAALDELGGPNHHPGSRQVVVFLSDGGNTGADPAAAIARLRASGAEVVSIGVGAEIDFQLLQRIASSRSNYFYAPGAGDLSWVYNSMTEGLCRNQPPLVHAGGNQNAYAVRLPESLILQGEVHDDGPAGDPRLTSAWTVVSGPGTVTFADASSPVTTALFTTPGTYVLQLEASDGFYETADRATITVDTEPSLAGATLVAALGTPSPLTVGTAESLILTLRDAAAHAITDFPIQITVTGPNAGTSTLTTNASGVATLSYTSQTVGTDILSAVALGMSPLSAAPVSLSWTAAASESVVTQGWIGGPTHQSTVSGQVPITLGAGITLTSGTVTYWPLSAPDQLHTLATGVSGGPETAIAALDTTVLANGPWIVKLDGTDSDGATQVSEVSVTVSGDYKPGRVIVDLTEFTIPLPGMPLTVGRRYDSLERDNVGDFGHGWSLKLGHPKLEVDPAHNVTMTMPNGRRVTFYFQAQSVTNSILFSYLLGPSYVPEAGTYGSFTADGCPLMIVSGGQLVCFLEGSLNYAPTTYTYTDPYGRVFTMGASGELRSIKDRQANVLTFTPSGISGTTGVALAITRDSAGRIAQLTTPPLDLSNVQLDYTYSYDSAGDLTAVGLPTNNQFALLHYTYDADHFLLTTKDANGNFARTSTYDDSGRLATDTDALGNVTRYAYDLGARKTTITNPDTGTVQEAFDDKGLLLKEVDPLGRTTQHTYDANRNELTRTNALNEVSTFAYDSHGNQISMSNGRGETTHVTYNSLSQPLTSTDPSGHTTTIGYDDLGIPTQFSDEAGTLSTFTSSAHGLPLTITDAAGHTAYMTYDASGNLTSRTDRLGRLSQYAYDGMGRRTTMTDPRGGETRYFYDGMGVLRIQFDPLGNGYTWDHDFNENLVDENKNNNYFPYERDTRYTLDGLNRVTQARYFDGTTTGYTRDFRGNKLTETDESGRTTTYQYDKAGQLVKATYPDGSFTTRAYDVLGRLVTATDERGNATTHEYEAGCGCADRATKVTDALGRATVTTYDAFGRRASVTDAAGHTTGYVYDGRGHLTETDYADGTKDTDTYDVLGRRTAHTDQMGSVTQYGYDAEGQLTSVTDALSNVTQYAYDLSGNLALVTDANNHVTSFQYDLLNRKTSRTLPLGMTETFGYDIVGNEVSHVDFRGKTTTYDFDHRDRHLTKVPDPSLSEPTVTFAYNPTGTRESMVDASGTTTYGYDSRDRLLTKGTPAGTLSYTHDLAGNVATIRSSNGNGTSVDYVWDAANQLVSATDNRAGGVTTAAYTATGRPSTVTQPSGVGVAYAYDTGDRATSLTWKQGTNPTFASWSYAFNARGQRTSATDATGRRVAYGYDAVSRLASETITSDPRGATANGELLYSLDPTGDRLTRTSTLAALGGQTFTYDSNDELTTESYDANGNTTTSNDHSYAYDFEDRLVSKDAGTVTIAYDGDGNRVTKTVEGVTTKYLVDDLNPTGFLQVMEQVVSGNVQTQYTYGTTLVSQRRVTDGGQMSYYGYDAHGNVTFLADAAGALTDSYDYDAFGNVVASEGATPNTRLYAGEELDPDIGLVNLRARQYKPSGGRFLTIDAAAVDRLNPLSLNRYVYGNAEPVNGVDPLGLASGTEYGGPGLGAVLALEQSAVVVLGASPAAGQAVVLVGSAAAVGYGIVCAFYVASSGYDLAVENTSVIEPPVPFQYCRKSLVKTLRRRGGDIVSLPKDRSPCPPGVRLELQLAVNELCKRSRSCDGLTSCSAVRAAIQMNWECAQARARINEQCFPPAGDPGHQNGVDDALRSVYKCEDALLTCVEP